MAWLELNWLTEHFTHLGEHFQNAPVGQAIIDIALIAAGFELNWLRAAP